MFKTELEQMNACDEAVDWVGNRDIKTAWKECERADWLLWYLSRKLDKKKIVYLSALCAETVVDIYNKKHPGDDRVSECIKACKDYYKGNISFDELMKKKHAAYAYAAYDAYSAAAYAAYSAAAYSAAAYVAAAAAAAAAAAVATYAADAADAAVARKNQHIKMCKIIRKNVKLKEIIGGVENELRR